MVVICAAIGAIGFGLLAYFLAPEEAHDNVRAKGLSFLAMGVIALLAGLAIRLR